MRVMSIFLREPIYSYEDPEEAHFVVQLEDTIIQTVGLSHEYILALTELDHVLLVNVQDYGTFKSNPGNFTNDLKYPGGSSKRSISSGYTHFVKLIQFQAPDITLNLALFLKYRFGPEQHGAITKKRALIIGGNNNKGEADVVDDGYIVELMGKYVPDVSFGETKNVILFIDLK
ncbi:hypothetical protein G6F56_002954 [Rhizopus delemar]|nr:hypothetical protein G6F56_002954 [Rhizopus delemar]